jgi:hypothetical protein
MYLELYIEATATTYIQPNLENWLDLASRSGTEPHGAGSKLSN